MLTQTINLKRRIGKFYVHDEMLKDALEGRHELIAGLSAIFAEAIIVRAECRYDRCAFEYIAYHPQFDEVEMGMEAPTYEVMTTREVGEHGITSYSIKFTRIR